MFTIIFICTVTFPTLRKKIIVKKYKINRKVGLK